MRQASDRISFKEFVQYFRRTVVQMWTQHPILATVWSCLFLITAAIPIMQVPLQKHSIDGLTQLQAGSGAWFYVMGLVVAFYLLPMVGSLVGLYQTHSGLIIKENVTYHYKLKLAEKAAVTSFLSYEDADYYDRLNLAQMSVMRNTVQIVETSFLLISYAISLTGLFWILYATHWSLPFALVVSAVPGMIILLAVKKSTFRINVQSSPLSREADYVYRLLLRRESAKEIRLFQAKGFLLERWSELFLKLRDVMIQQNIRDGFAQLAGGLLLTLASACFAMILVYFVAQGEVTLGDYVSLTGAVVAVQTILGSISGKIGLLFELGLFMKNLFTFLDEPEESVQSGNLPFPKQWEEIRIENLTFQYPGREQSVLQNVSFSIKRGETIAIVGENGSGKTTLVHCLLGLYPTQGESIYYGQHLLTAIEKNSFYKHVSAVFQDFYRYHFSIAENLAVGKWDAKDDLSHLHEVLEKVKLSGVVESLPQGLKTYLGRELGMGVELSGGQWQRIAIARAFLRDADVLVLDEPTSALDPFAEMEVFEQFIQLTEGKTAIIISHRLGVTRLADRILVMKEGRLVEFGNQQKLLERNGEFAKMYRSQAEWYQEEIQERKIIGRK